jgi:hypothetical protein
MSIEVMKQAVEAFEHIKKYVTDDGAMPENWDAYHEKEYFALEALRQAIEQAEKESTLQEMSDIGQDIEWDTSDMAHRSGGLTVDDDIQEYKRPWVGLTEDESDNIYNAHHNTYGECITSAYDLVLDVEAKLKEKNGG